MNILRQSYVLSARQCAAGSCRGNPTGNFHTSSQWHIHITIITRHCLFTVGDI